MSLPEPLQGSELIDCARANGNKGIAVASERCGYGNDLNVFEQALKKASDDIGVHIQGFSDLVNPASLDRKDIGIEIAPDTPNQL